MGMNSFNKFINNVIITLFLSFFLFIGCKSKPEYTQEIVAIVEEEEEEIPEIVVLKPEFEVVSIIILQADLVVTELETVLKVTNPNDFAVELISLTYELFGNGPSWARGIATNILHVPAKSSGETRFRFSMNFTSQNRRLLDDIIALRPVNYRLRGEAIVRPVIQNVESFTMVYDVSGISDVRGRSR